jgi:hypothetical protein
MIDGYQLPRVVSIYDNILWLMDVVTCSVCRSSIIVVNPLHCLSASRVSVMTLLNFHNPFQNATSSLPCNLASVVLIQVDQ